MKFTPVVLRNLFSKPATRLYPFVKRTPYKNTRGSVGIDINSCIYCGICQKKCPTDAIVVAKADRLWQIDRMRCIACSACVDACPKKCLTMDGAYAPSATAKNADRFVGAEKPKATPA
jgi:formate hydrogenlyase subunit 6/NADH:ubiquinone oxidoreductase subunit I